MKTIRQLAGLLALNLALASTHAQTALPPGDSFTAPSGNTTYTLPPDGQVNYRTFTVPSGAIIKFTRNAANTPVYIIATGDVSIQGIVDVSGSVGSATGAGISGPGGFDGGAPAIGVSPPGDGLGPGAGGGFRPATSATPSVAVGHAAFGTRPTASSTQNGEEYGTKLLMPLVGGSGGGGSAAVGGGGGGGALLIKSDTVINISGAIKAQGAGVAAVGGGIGSGGAIRLVAPVIRGNGVLDVAGSPSGNGGSGRIRCDLTDRSNFAGLRFIPALGAARAPVTTDQFMPLAFPPSPVPVLRIVSVGGMAVPANAPFTVILPLNGPTDQPVAIQASGFGTTVPVTLKRTPVSGAALPDIDLEIPITGRLTQTVPFPANVPITLNLWTR